MKIVLPCICTSRWKSKCFWLCVILTSLGLVFRDNAVFDEPRLVKSTPADVPKWIKDAKNMEMLDENVLRCAAEKMGCFTLLPTVLATKVNENFTLELCLDICFKRKTSFAGLRGRKCYCSPTVDNFVSTRLCDAACSVDKSRNCTSNGSIVVYRKTKGCSEGATESSLKGDIVGCTALPKNITGNVMVWSTPQMTISQCVLKCESQKFVLATPLLRHHSCLCSDLRSMFGSAEEMQRKMRSCEGSTVANTLRDGKFPIYKTYVEECGPKRFLKRLEGPFTILTSFWGSGNTWLRHLIEIATGIYTGSIYMDDYLYRGGMIGEKMYYLSGRTIVIKDHIMSKPESVSKKYKSAILILRNPYDATLAEYARMHSHNNHTALLDPKIYESEAFKKSVRILPQKWIFHVKMLFNLISPVLVIYYEDLQQNPVRELKRIISFLPPNVVSHQGDELEKRLMCMNLDLTGSFKRGSKGLKSNPFDAELQRIYSNNIEKMNLLLTSQNKTGLPSSYFNEWKL